MRSYHNRFSAEAGTIATNYEVVGFRPGYAEWAELLHVTDDIQSFIDQDDPQDFQGFERVAVITPGCKRPVDVLQTPETTFYFLAIDGGKVDALLRKLVAKRSEREKI